MISDRQLALEAIGKSVTRFFNQDDLDTAWIWETWRLKLEKMTDQEFIDQYEIEKDRNI